MHLIYNVNNAQAVKGIPNVNFNI